jgi:hypothetical protein
MGLVLEQTLRMKRAAREGAAYSRLLSGSQ